MNSMSKRIRLRKERIAEERRKAEEKKYLASLSKEERDTYLKNKQERSKQAMRLLTTAMSMAISASAYGVNYKEDNEEE